MKLGRVVSKHTVRSRLVERTFMTMRGAGRRVGSVGRHPGLSALDNPSDCAIRDAKESGAGPDD